VELVTEDDTPSSHGSTDTKSHHLPPPSTPPNPASSSYTRRNLEDISRQNTREYVKYRSIYYTYIKHTHNQPTHRRKEPNKMEWKKLMNLLLLPTTNPQSLKKKQREGA
jgi:hypothetical protein